MHPNICRPCSHTYRRLFVFCVVLFACLLAAVAGCSSGGGDNDSGPDSSAGETPDSSDVVISGQREFTLETATDESGVAAATFSVPSDTTKLSVTAFSPGALRFVQLSDGRGIDYLTPGGLQLALSTDFSAIVSNVTAPSRGLDPALDGSGPFTARTEVSPAGAETPVLFQVISRADPDLLNGTLRVNVFRIAGVTGDPDVDNAVNRALDEFRSIYAQNAGIQVVFSEAIVDAPVNLPFPFEGDDLYRQLSESAPAPAVNLALGGNVQGLGGEILGIAGGIPGPPIPSPRSAVAVSVIAGAGPDGLYSESEINVLGETMAHEVGHFHGLFHPVEIESLDQADPLTDTPACGSNAECEANPTLVGNLMFPTPVGDGAGGVIRQNQITAQQREVLNRYIAVE